MIPFKIHEAGAMVEGVQRCNLCGQILFQQDKVDPRLYKIQQRIQSVKNNTTQAIALTSDGWKVGTRLKDFGRKIEVTKEKTNCNNQPEESTPQ